MNWMVYLKSKCSKGIKNQLKSNMHRKLPQQLMPFVYNLANSVQNSPLLFYRWSGWQETSLNTK